MAKYETDSFNIARVRSILNDFMQCLTTSVAGFHTEKLNLLPAHLDKHLNKL